MAVKHDGTWFHPTQTLVDWTENPHACNHLATARERVLRDRRGRHPRLDDQVVSGPGERGPHIGSEAPEQGLPYDNATAETPAHEWTNPRSASS